jgi:hypothetical protein
MKPTDKTLAAKVIAISMIAITTIAIVTSPMILIWAINQIFRTGLDYSLANYIAFVIVTAATLVVTRYAISGVVTIKGGAK